MKRVERWHSNRLHQEITVARWGEVGSPVLLFPTAGGDAEEAERFGLVDAVAPLLSEGRIKLYSVDSVAGRVLTAGGASHEHCSWILNRFHDAVYHEVVPAIQRDCHSASIEVITAGASIGAFNAVSALCRHPDVFRAAIAMSGTFDLVRLLPNGLYTQDFYFASALHFVPQLAEDSPQLACLRRRFVLLACGQGRWEDPSESWRMAEVLGARGVPNRLDPWGEEWDHDWISWRRMLPQYLDELVS